MGSLPSRPDPLENDFRPAGQIHAVVAPLDALRAARGDDVHRRARRRRARPRRPPTPTSRFPTRSSDPRRAPRSGCARGPALRRARTRRWCRPETSRASTSAGPRRLKRSASGSGPRTMHWGLPDCEHRGRDGLASDVDRGLPKIRRLPHRGAKGVALPVTRQQLERLHAGVGVNRHASHPVEILVARDERRQTSQPVARQLRRSCHPHSAAASWRHDRAGVYRMQPVGADPVVAMAHGARERGQIATGLVAASAAGNRCRRRAPSRRERTTSRNLKRVEHVGEPGGEAEARVAATSGRTASRHRPASPRSCSGRRRERCRATRCRAAGRRSRVSDAAVDLADDLGRLRQRARERQAVGQHVVLPIAARRIAQDAQAARCRRRGPTAPSWPPGPTRRSRSCRGRGRSRSMRSGSLVANRSPNDGRTRVSPADSDLRADDDVLDARGRIAGGRDHVGQRRRRLAIGDASDGCRTRHRSGSRRSS